MHEETQGVQSSLILTSTDGREWSASRPGGLIPGKETRANGKGGWGSSRAGLDDLEERKIPWPCRKSNPILSRHSLVTIPYHSNVYYGTSLQDLNVRGASVASSSKIRVPAVLVLLTKWQGWDVLQLRNVYTKSRGTVGQMVH